MKHGHTSAKNGRQTRTYVTWVGMKARCDNPKATGYKNYGGAGIGYDPAWSDFLTFLKDMGERPEGCTLDRIDGSKGYSKENCRWATYRQQLLNQSRSKRVQFQGREWSIRELSEHLGLDWDTLNYRLKRGWSEEQIANTPPSKGNCKKVVKGWHGRKAWNKGMKFVDGHFKKPSP